ncbi:hypothetical protein RYZ27_05445 [Hyphomonas sp. FCG-A18]|uniref:hypothetical protein n=1 Tax=Hyphomonas sp. FCG-A18 TaxID=3080019 RepID=UPI002B3027F9|nr:hypothetical protein RYZ27_05445 [Hyphomonas sp. FCG-A18]
MVLVDWDDIPEVTRRFLQQKTHEGFPFDEGKYVLHGPEHFKPGYEARKIDALDYGDWEFGYDESMYRYVNRPNREVMFAFGHGFRQIEEDFQPNDPVKVRFGGKKLKRPPPLPAFCPSRAPSAILVSAAVFEILRQVEPLAEDRVLATEVYYRDERVDGEFYIIDPPSITDNIDLESSMLKWDKADSGKWLAREHHYGLAFKENTQFHLARDFLDYYISKDLLYTLYEANVGLFGEYKDWHADYYAHQYKPKSLV